MPKFEGCKQAKEISLTRKGANQHAHVLVKKTLGAGAGPANQPEPEKTPMPQAAATDVAKTALSMTLAIAKMCDVTKAHFFGLTEDAQLAFLEKSAEEQKAEAEAAKAEKDRKEAEAEAAKSGKTVEVVALEKRLADQDEIIKSLQAKQLDGELEKRAATEFAGFPGGVEAAVAKLRDISKLPEASRKGFEDMMKAQCDLAKSTTAAFGVRNDVDVSKAEGSKVKLVDAAKALAAQKSISPRDALEQITEKREFAADVEACEAAGVDLFAAVA